MATRKRKTQPRKKAAYHRSTPNIKKKARNRAALTIPDAATAAGFGITAVRKLVRSGELPSFNLGTKTYILRTVLAEWLEQRGRGQAVKGAA